MTHRQIGKMGATNREQKAQCLIFSLHISNIFDEKPENRELGFVL